MGYVVDLRVLLLVGQHYSGTNTEKGESLWIMMELELEINSFFSKMNYWINQKQSILRIV